MTSEVATRRSRLVSQVVATLVCTVLALLLAGWVVLGVQTHEMRSIGATLFDFLVFGAVGFVLALRQPRKPIGWLLLFTGLVTTFGNDAKLYSLIDYRLHPGSLPLGLVAVFVAGWISTIGLFIVAPAALLFPDGRLPSRRWRWVWRTYLASGFLLVVGSLIGELGILGQRIYVDASGNPTNNPTGVLSHLQGTLSRSSNPPYLAVLGRVSGAQYSSLDRRTPPAAEVGQRRGGHLPRLVSG